MIFQGLMLGMSKQANQAAIRKIIANQGSYGFGDDQWNFSGICRSTQTRDSDIRKAEAILAVMDGLSSEGNREQDSVVTWNGLPITAKLLVLSRQACHADSKGQIIFKTQSQMDNSMESGFLLDGDGVPVVGDIIRIKQGMIRTTDEGKNITASDLDSRIKNGEPIYHYREYRLDSNLCITVPYPDVIRFLRMGGERIAQPKFRKIGTRKISNWLFREVNHDYSCDHETKRKS